MHCVGYSTTILHMLGRPRGLVFKTATKNHSVLGSSPTRDLCCLSVSLISCHLSTICDKGTKKERKYIYIYTKIVNIAGVTL